MSNLLAGKIILGSSNVYRLYDNGNKAAIKDYKMIKCTRAETFDAHMSNLNEESGMVLVSVVENFITDAVTNESEPDAEIVHCLDSFLGVIEAAATRLPATKFGIVMPLGRPRHAWYQDRVVEIAGKLSGGIRAMSVKNGSINVASIKCSPESTQDFMDDGVHLTVASAKIFVDTIVSGADTYLANTPVDLTNDQDGPDLAGVDDLERRLTILELAYKKQVEINFANNLIMTRTREELDSAGNRSKEDRVVMTGLKSNSVMPVDNRARIEWLKKIAMNIFEDLIPGFPGKILYLNQGKSMDRYLPMIEVKIDSVTNAIAIRRAFAAKRKDKSLKPELETLFVTNCVNLATRVRIDVLKALARKVTSGKDLAYVSGFISRPMMHIKAAGSPINARPQKSFTYIDAISRFGNLLSRGDLTTAYDRAGIAFKGQMSQNFVVLNDDEPPNPRAGPTPRSSGAPSGSGSSRGGHGPGGRAQPGSTDHNPRGVKRPGHDLTNDKRKK
jgi:hypothetical protein